MKHGIVWLVVCMEQLMTIILWVYPPVLQRSNVAGNFWTKWWIERESHRTQSWIRGFSRDVWFPEGNQSKPLIFLTSDNWTVYNWKYIIPIPKRISLLMIQRCQAVLMNPKFWCETVVIPMYCWWIPNHLSELILGGWWWRKCSSIFGDT